MDITLEFEPAVDEVISTIARNSRKAKRNLWINVVWMFAFAIAAGGFGQWIVSVVLILCGAFCLMVVRAMPAARARTASTMCLPTTLHLTADRFTYTRGTEQGQGMWGLTRVVIGPESYTFAVANKAVIILPKRAMSPQDLATFETVVSGMERKLVKVV